MFDALHSKYFPTIVLIKAACNQPNLFSISFYTFNYQNWIKDLLLCNWFSLLLLCRNLKNDTYLFQLEFEELNVIWIVDIIFVGLRIVLVTGRSL